MPACDPGRLLRYQRGRRNLSQHRHKFLTFGAASAAPFLLVRGRVTFTTLLMRDLRRRKRRLFCCALAQADARRTATAARRRRPDALALRRQLKGRRGPQRFGVCSRHVVTALAASGSRRDASKCRGESPIPCAMRACMVRSGFTRRSRGPLVRHWRPPQSHEGSNCSAPYALPVESFSVLALPSA
jgi:hypothetical protein